MVIMPMGRDYVSELRSITDLLFNHQVLYDHGEPWWNDEQLIMEFRIVFWDVLLCKIILDRRFRGTCCLHHPSYLMMEAARTSETSVDNYFTRQYIQEENSELHTRRRENLKSQTDNSGSHSCDTFWDVAPCSLVEVYRLLMSMVTLMMEAENTSETTVDFY
jgi:hypothetical protein